MQGRAVRDDMSILAMTRLRLKSIGLFPRFIWANEAVIAQLRAAPGFLRGKLLAEPSLAMWTASLWLSEESMRAFYLSGAHRGLMPRLKDFACEATVGHISYESSELPSWQFVHEELCKAGRYSDMLSEANDDHRNRIVARPKFAFLTRQLRPTSSIRG
jgi:hypothetical protein